MWKAAHAVFTTLLLEHPWPRTGRTKLFSWSMAVDSLFIFIYLSVYLHNLSSYPPDVHYNKPEFRERKNPSSQSFPTIHASLRIRQSKWCYLLTVIINPPPPHPHKQNYQYNQICFIFTYECNMVVCVCGGGWLSLNNTACRSIPARNPTECIVTSTRPSQHIFRLFRHSSPWYTYLRVVAVQMYELTTKYLLKIVVLVLLPHLSPITYTGGVI